MERGGTEQVAGRRLAVIGAGVAGRAFALRCVAAGLIVTLEDVMPEKLRRAQDAYAGLHEPGATGSLRVATEVEGAVHDADLAIDFVPDELESKLEIFSLLDRMAPPRTVLCTPTEVLSVTDLASCTYRADKCLALRGGLAGDAVAVVRGRGSSGESVALVLEVLDLLRMRTTVIEDAADVLLTRNLRQT